MRVGVYGAGSIGAYVGGRLAASGVAVTLVGRAPLAAAVAAEGLRVSDFRGFDVTLPPTALTVATTADALADYDCVLVTVKALDSAAAAAALAPVLREGAIVVSLQNGVRNVEQLATALGPRAVTVVAGMVGFNVLGKSARHFHQATSGRLAIAALSSGAPPPVAAALAAAGVPTDVERDLAPIQWGKLLFNLNNAVNALSGVPLAEQLGSRGYRRIMAACIREGHAVLARAGIAAKFDAPVPTSWIPTLMELPTPLFRLLARKMVAVDPSARSSMWEDLQRRRPTEIDLLNGEIVALGRAHGVPTPFNTRLIELVKSYENQPPPSLSAEVLWRDLTATSRP
jgi:2-dehydropantoate 2-reductase